MGLTLFHPAVIIGSLNRSALSIGTEDELTI